MKRGQLIFILILLTVVFIPFGDAFAQCIPPQFECCPVPDACGPTCPTCPPVPIDGGLGALLIAGVAYGAKRIYRSII